MPHLNSVYENVDRWSYRPSAYWQSTSLA